MRGNRLILNRVADRQAKEARKLLKEARLLELRKRGFELTAELKAISLQLSCISVELGEKKIQELTERQSSLAMQLEVIEEKLKDLYT